MASEEQDFLEEMLAESEAEFPGFTELVDEAYRRRVFGRALATRRKALGISQSEVARRMRTTQPAVRRLEEGADVRMSTVVRYLHVIGVPADWPEQFAITG